MASAGVFCAAGAAMCRRECLLWKRGAPKQSGSKQRIETGCSVAAHAGRRVADLVVRDARESGFGIDVAMALRLFPRWSTWRGIPPPFGWFRSTGSALDATLW